MPRKSKADAVNIYEAFPNEYESLKSTLKVNENTGKIELRNTIDEFIVHPEYEIRFKLQNMFLAQTERTEGFSKLYKKKKNTREDILHTHRRENLWVDYMFQIPQIEKILGVKRAYKIKHLEEVFQDPILFLLLFYYRENLLKEEEKCSLLYKEMCRIKSRAVKSIKKEKKSNDFSLKELNDCSNFFFEQNMFFEKDIEGILNKIKKNHFYDFQVPLSLKDNFGSWNLSSVRRQSEKVDRDILDILSSKIIEKPMQGDEADCKGKTFCFPTYMRSIFVGIANNYKVFPFVMQDELMKEKPLWAQLNGKYIQHEDDELVKAFNDIVRYIRYKDTVRTFLDKSKWSDENISDFLLNYYKFCIKALYSVFIEKKSYSESAQYTFEKIYSLYFFDRIMKVLSRNVNLACVKIEEEIKDIKKVYGENGVKDELVEEIFVNLENNDWYKLYSSPGVFHRVYLAEYIIENQCNVDILVNQFISNYEWLKSIYESHPEQNLKYSEDNLRKKLKASNANDIKQSWGKWQKTDVIINKINYDYSVLEKHYLKSCVDGKTGNLLKEDIDFIGIDAPEIEEYNKFYADIQYSICKNSGFACEKLMKGEEPSKSDCARCILDVYKEDEEFIKKCAGQLLNKYADSEEKRLLFWIIVYSFLSDKDLGVEVKSE